MPFTLDTVTHVAGPVIRIGDRVLQRCPICGEKLRDSAGADVPLLPNGKPGTVGMWAEASLVQFDGARQSVIGSFDDENVPLPEDFCLELVEA